MSIQHVINTYKNSQSDLQLEHLLILGNLQALDEEKVKNIFLKQSNNQLIGKILDADIYYASNPGLTDDVYSVISDTNVNIEHLLDYFCYINNGNVQIINKKLNPEIIPFFLISHGLNEIDENSARDLFNMIMLKELKADSIGAYVRGRRPFYNKINVNGINAVYSLKSTFGKPYRRNRFKVIFDGK